MGLVGLICFGRNCEVLGLVSGVGGVLWVLDDLAVLSIGE